MIPNFTYSQSEVSQLNEAGYNIQRKSLGEHKNWLQVSQKCVHENLEPVGCRNWIPFNHKDISELLMWLTVSLLVCTVLKYVQRKVHPQHQEQMWRHACIRLQKAKATEF